MASKERPAPAGQSFFCYFRNLMKRIVLFGDGKSATVLIEYLLQQSELQGWKLSLVDADKKLAEEKLKGSPFGEALTMDVRKESELQQTIAGADIVISLMPPALHQLIAKACIAQRKNLLTASYVDAAMKELSDAIQQNDLFFLCEMGLDPGIDHMSAKKMIDEIKAEGGEITSFVSHCGGLVAPESDDNPWHYKISWNPANVVNAGKDGAIFRQNGEIKELDYEELFAEKRYVSIPSHEVLCWYPNRDSLRYINTYGLEKAETFLRTTLRHPDFIYGWKNIIDLKLTSAIEAYETDGKSLAAWFKEHMEKHQFGEWLQGKLSEQLESTKNLLSELVNLVKLEEQAEEKGVNKVEDFMMVDEKGDLQKVDIDDLKISAAATLADRMHDANLTLKQLFFLGMDDEKTVIDKGNCSTAQILQFALEKKLALQPVDKDMVVMLHEIEYKKEGETFKNTSCMIVKGENSSKTAMAKTVGMPLGIAAKLILDGTIKTKGLHIPVIPEIYQPVLTELEKHGILFTEQKVKLPQ